MVVAFRRWAAGQRDQVGFAPVVQLAVPVDLAPVPQGPVQPFLAKPESTDRGRVATGRIEKEVLL